MEEHRLIEQFDLKNRLDFAPSKGQIWFNEARMLLFHAKGMARLRREIIEHVGLARARSIFWRMGFECGRMDARVAEKHQGQADDYDVFCIGPALHALEGIAQAHIVNADIDWEQGTFDGVVHWKDSWEAQAHLEDGLPISEDYPGACWAATGYASGYVTEFFKRTVIFQETQCACSGHAQCVVEGRAAEHWEDKSFVEALLNATDDAGQFDVEEELRRLRRARAKVKQPNCPNKPDDIVGNSAVFLESFTLLGKAAGGSINVLLLGETGVGKEVFARWLHDHSKETGGPFVAVNCSAIPAELVEAELFGVRRGAFTGATETRKGRFERADGGTLFLDEIGDLPLAAQAKLLRALQSGEIERLGDDTPIKVNVRLISATNVDLADAMKRGDFRSDLYYRLATYPINIPPLRDRGGDIALLAKAMVMRYAPRYGKAVLGITERVAHVLEAYPWPGNVRELENFIERAVLLVDDGKAIEIDHLPIVLQELASKAEQTAAHPTGAQGASRKQELAIELMQLGANLAEQEELLVTHAIAMSDGNVTEAAKLLGISRRQMAYRLDKLGLGDSALASETE